MADDARCSLRKPAGRNRADVAARRVLSMDAMMKSLGSASDLAEKVANTMVDKRLSNIVRPKTSEHEKQVAAMKLEMLKMYEDCKIAGSIVEVGPGKTPVEAMRAEMLSLYEELKRDGTIIEVGPEEEEDVATGRFTIARTPSRRDSSPGPAPDIDELLAPHEEARRSLEITRPLTSRSAQSFNLGSQTKGAGKAARIPPMNSEKRQTEFVLEPNTTKRLSLMQVMPSKRAGKYQPNDSKQDQNSPQAPHPSRISSQPSTSNGTQAGGGFWGWVTHTCRRFLTRKIES